MQMLLKSCLKSVGGAAKREVSSSARPAARRNVSFRGKDTDEVHAADDWDRSAVDVTPKLSYDDILELKEMQIAAARACARAQAASGLPSRYLSNVPVALLPLLPESPATSSPSSSSSSSPRDSSPSGPRTGGVLASPLLSEACLCRIFSADTGVRTSPSSHVCPVHSSPSSPPPPRTRSSSSYPSPLSPAKANIQTPSPPDTPPRPLITPMPPPRPARSFAFLPLLETPTTTPEVTPSTSAVTSPVLSPSGSSTALNSSSPVIQYSTSNVGAGPSSSYGAYSNPSLCAYGAYSDSQQQVGFGYGRTGVGGHATLGLERKLGYGVIDTSESEPSGSDVEMQDEDDDWPKDWPGKRVHKFHKAPPVKKLKHGDQGSESGLPPSPPVEDSMSKPTSLAQNHNPYFPPVPPSSSPSRSSPQYPNRRNRPPSLSASPQTPHSSYPPSPSSPSFPSSSLPNVQSPPSSPSLRSSPGSPRSRHVPSRTSSPVIGQGHQRRSSGSPSASPVLGKSKMSLVILA